jgi:hypothetical protein
MSPATEALATLRDRLTRLRDDLRQRIATAETIDPAWLGLLANAETVIAALDRDV